MKMWSLKSSSKKNPVPIIKNIFTLIVVFVSLLSCQLITAQDGIAQAGSGSYLTTRPKPCKPLPQTQYRSSDLKGFLPTSQWWSSLIWQKYSQNIFAHPLALRCMSNGIAVWYPGARITANSSGIFGAGPAHGTGDLRLGHSSAQYFEQAVCSAFSDWFVTALFTNETASLSVSFGHGSPYLFCKYSGGNPTLTFPTKPQIWAGSSKDPLLGITVNEVHYGLFGPSGSTWSGLDTQTFTNNLNGKFYFSVAVLPDNRPETLALFRKYAYNHITDTRAEFEIIGGKVKTDYKFFSKPLQGNETDTIFALYPHQWKYTITRLTDYSYRSVRGLMKVGIGKVFSTETPIQGVLPFLPPEGIKDHARVLSYLKEEANKKSDGFGDTYWEGKRLGRLATLSGVAEAAGAPELQKVFVEEIKRTLENWFTATAGKEQPLFYYASNWGTIIGSRPSYGSDFPLNDHHFHYGYFIRAASEVARLEPDWAKKWGEMISLLIRDIASGERNDPMFPYLRCFDIYAGHSWASGDANFADGNNQESSSESLNAWYGLMLWGEITGDTKTRDRGIFLFNTERTAVEEYWLDVDGTNFPDDFPNVALGMVWGGKGAFGTWFSGDIDCIHGINWLPFTPASIYLGRHPDYVKKNYDRVIEKRKGGKDYNTGWGDLLIMFYALSDPATAANYIDSNPDCRVESGNTRAFMYHWIHTLNILGINDPAVTADYPFYNVYRKDGHKTYAVYNFKSSPITVNFCDGTTLTAKSKGLTVLKK